MTVSEIIGKKIAIQCHNTHRYQSVVGILAANGIDTSKIAYQHAFQTCIAVDANKIATLHFYPEIESEFEITPSNIFILDNNIDEQAPKQRFFTQEQACSMFNFISNLAVDEDITNGELVKCKAIDFLKTM